MSLAGGDWTTQLRSAIQCAYPDALLSGAPELTTQYLSSLDVVLIASTYSGSSVVAPLSSAEQDALLQFVLSGGTALLFVDNDTFSGIPITSIVNNSLIRPFGVHVTGNTSTAQVQVTNPTAHRVTNGSFGRINSFVIRSGGWFDDLGSHAQCLAVLTSGLVVGECALAVIPRDALGSGSGLVAVFSDASILFDGIFNDDTRRLVCNAIELAPRLCYPDCDTSTGVGVLDIFDFLCFQNAFVAGCP